MQKFNFTYNDVHNTICDSAKRILESGYNPDYILAIGGGGLIPARILRTYIDRPILMVAVARYTNDTDTAKAGEPRKLQWLETDTNLAGKKVLVVDEIDDERTTLEFTLNHLIEANPEAEFSVYVVHNKVKEKKGQIPAAIEHYFAGMELGDDWVNYAWDAEDINNFGE